MLSGNFDEGELIEIAKCIKLELARPPEFNSCAVGEPANIDNLYINAIFDDGTRDTLPVNYKMFSEPDLQVADEQRQSIISYAGQTLKVGIPLRNSRLEHIEAQAKKKLVYQAGDSFNKEDVVVTAHYSDGSSRVIQNYKCSPFYSIKQGVKEVKIRYGGCKAFVPIEVTVVKSDSGKLSTEEGTEVHVTQEKTVAAISIAKRPNRQRYLLGDNEVDLTGGKLDLVYSDGSVGQIEMIADGNISIDSSAIGQGKIEFYCFGKIVSFYVEILEPKIVKLWVDQPPIKVNYTEGDTLDLTGLVLQATYNDGSTRPVYGLQSNGYIVSLADNEHGVTFAFEQQPFVIKIKVASLPKEIKVLDVSLGKAPYKTQYIERETKSPDLTGAELLLQMSDGRRQALAVTNDMVTGFKIDGQGQGVLELKYDDTIINCPITVIERSLLSLECDSNSSKSEYFENELFDLKGVVLYALYDNGEKEVITDYELHKNKASAGDTCITLSYKGFTTSYPISVKPLANTVLLGLNITQKPKTEYFEEDIFNADGMIVEALYSGDIVKVVDFGCINYIPDRPLKKTDKHILVCFEDKAAILPIKVNSKETEQVKSEISEEVSEVVMEPVNEKEVQITKPPKNNNYACLPSFYPSSFNLRFEDPPDDFAF